MARQEISRLGWQAERVNRRRNQGKRVRMEEGEKEERRMPGASHPATQPAME